MHILGLSAQEHGPAAAIIGENGVIAAIEEGKLARTRSVESIPRRAIQFCLDSAGIRWQDCDRIAIASRPGRTWSRTALFRARLAPFAPKASVYFLNKASGELGRELKNFRIRRGMAASARARVQGFDPHLSHAASAYFASPFDRALIVTFDERGDGRCGFAGVGEGQNIRELGEIPCPTS